MNEMLTPKHMTVDEFIPWAMAQPSGRYELHNGEVVMMSPERARHVRGKAATYRALFMALQRAGLDCEAMPDGGTVRIDKRTAYEPDALVYCGPRLGGDEVEIPNPVVVVEVVSPSTRNVDTGMKVSGYFSLPSVRHYLIVDAEKRFVIHHARADGGGIVSTSYTEGTLSLDPPGLEVAVAEMLPEDDSEI